MGAHEVVEFHCFLTTNYMCSRAYFRYAHFKKILMPCCWKCDLVQCFGKSFGSRYQEIYKFMAFDSLIPFLGTSPKETILIIEKALCTKVSISAPLLIAKYWKDFSKSG